MAKILLVCQSELPPPRPGYDLVIWPGQNAPSHSRFRSWAGWSESALLVGNLADGTVIGYSPQGTDWSGTDLAVGLGKVWRFQHHYIAWLQQSDLRVPEIARALSLAGVGLIIADSGQYASPFLDPLWRAVQANQVYGLAVGSSPALYLPCELDSEESGVLPLNPDGGDLSVEVALEHLNAVQKAVPIRQGLRPHLYKAHRWW